MGRNRKLREKVSAHERNIKGHKRKVVIERAKPMPNEELIAHWQAEITEWEKQRARLLRRLRRDW